MWLIVLNWLAYALIGWLVDEKRSQENSHCKIERLAKIKVKVWETALEVA